MLTPSTTGDFRPATAACWFCEGAAESTCRCGRAYCQEHSLGPYCMVCSLAFGVYEHVKLEEPLSDLIRASLSAVSADPYIVVPPKLQQVRPLPMLCTERLLGTLLQVAQSPDPEIRRRGVTALARTLNSWPTLNPSQITPQNYSAGLLAAEQVRRWLLYLLKQSRSAAHEPIAVSILDNLCTADFRDPYPAIVESLQMLKYSPVGVRIRDVFDTLAEYYPTGRLALDERCELCVYAQYTSKHKAVRDLLQRLYGPGMRFSPNLAKMLKKGMRQSDYPLYQELYPGEVHDY